MNGTPVMATKAPALLTLKDVQANWKVSRSFLYKEMVAGRIKPLKIGKSLRFVENEIDQWLIDRIAARNARGTP
jgi:predicted DNA-binding transcriptional regulator AlpA